MCMHPLYELSQTSSASVLKHIVKVGFILESEELFYYVWVVQLTQEVSFTEHIVYFLVLYYMMSN